MDLTRFIEKATPLGVLGVIVSQNGEISARHAWEGVCRRNVYSVTKSFTAVAVGIAESEGLLTIDEKLTDAFSDELPENVSENLKLATVRDLLTMSLGQDKAYFMGEQRPNYTETDWVKLALSKEFKYAPDERFLYSNTGPYLAGVLVQRRAGCTLSEYLKPRLFDHLGVNAVSWEVDPHGYNFGSSGLFLTLDELHRFGLMMQNGGVIGDKRIVPENWVAECGKKQVENGADGYGYLFWRGPHNTYRADGMYCQLSIIVPDKNAVITTVSECRRGDLLNEAIYGEIYPQL